MKILTLLSLATLVAAASASSSDAISHNYLRAKTENDGRQLNAQALNACLAGGRSTPLDCCLGAGLTDADCTVFRCLPDRSTLALDPSCECPEVESHCASGIAAIPDDWVPVPGTSICVQAIACCSGGGSDGSRAGFDGCMADALSSGALVVSEPHTGPVSVSVWPMPPSMGCLMRMGKPVTECCAAEAAIAFQEGDSPEPVGEIDPVCTMLTCLESDGLSFRAGCKCSMIEEACTGRVMPFDNLVHGIADMCVQVDACCEADETENVSFNECLSEAFLAGDITPLNFELFFSHLSRPIPGSQAARPAAATTTEASEAAPAATGTGGTTPELVTTPGPDLISETSVAATTSTTTTKATEAAPATGTVPGLATMPDIVLISETSSTGTAATAVAGTVPTVTGIAVDPIELGPGPVVIEPLETTTTAATAAATTAATAAATQPADPAKGTGANDAGMPAVETLVYVAGSALAMAIV